MTINTEEYAPVPEERKRLSTDLEDNECDYFKKEPDSTSSSCLEVLTSRLLEPRIENTQTLPQEEIHNPESNDSEVPSIGNQGVPTSKVLQTKRLEIAPVTTVLRPRIDNKSALPNPEVSTPTSIKPVDQKKSSSLNQKNFTSRTLRPKALSKLLPNNLKTSTVAYEPESLKSGQPTISSTDRKPLNSLECSKCFTVFSDKSSLTFHHIFKHAK